MKFIFTLIISLFATLSSCQNNSKPIKTTSMSNNEKVIKSEEEWKKTLSPEQYRVLREKGTERPFSGEYYLKNDTGIYSCAACGFELFNSTMKFDSHCGWPSFDNEIGNGERVKKIKDISHGMIRTEIICARCDSHLGHIFDDGPTLTGNRYCVNSVSILFKPIKK
jgi:peptide-methionine (R)-S-oxide reductase